MAERFVRRGRKPAYRERKGRRGVALVMVLGIMGLLLILVMSYVYDASDTGNVAVNRVYDTKARLSCRGAVERATSFIVQELGNRSENHVFMHPGGAFYEPSDSSWVVGGYIPTVNASFDTDLSAQMAVSLGGYQFIPANATDALPGAGWSPIMGAKDTSTDGSTSMIPTLLGRVAYLIIDETGKIDPSHVVTTDTDETAVVTRTGAEATELQLGDLLESATLARAFHPSTSTTGHVGEMPPASGWMSYTHIIKSVASDQAEADSVAALILPTSVADREEFWIDVNSDSTATADELVPRLDLSQVGTTITAPMIYDHVLGVSAGNTTRDNPVYYSPWLRKQSPTDAAHARRLAAQLAVNMLDWTDDSTAVTHGFISSAAAGNNYELSVITDGNYSRPANVETVVHGVEDYVAVSKVSVRSNFLYPLGVILQLEPALWMQVSTPTGTGIPANGFTVNVKLSYTIVNALGSTYTVTRTLSVDETDFNAVATNGDASYYNMSGWKDFGGTNLGNVTLGGLTSFLVQSTRIDSIEVIHKAGAGQSFKQPVIRSYSGGSDTDFVCEWRETGLPLHTLGGLFTQYVLLESVDPLFCTRSELDSDFSDYWTKTPSASPSLIDTVATVLSAIGLGQENAPAVSSDGYDTHHDYCDVTIGDAPFDRFAQIGRVHGLAPNTSLRLWSKPGDTSGHDLHLLDLFKVGSQTQVNGRVNVNSRHYEVLRTLAANTGLTAADVAIGLQEANGTSGGLPFVYRGDMIGMFERASITGSLDKTTDETAEEAICAIAGLATTRQTYFTIVAVAESAQDLGEVGAQPADTYQWSSSPPKYARTVGRSTVMALIYRDAYTNDTKVLRYEQVND